MSSRADLLNMATAAAVAHRLDAALVSAVVEQESAWKSWSVRFEPAFWMKYVQFLRDREKLTVTESELRACSFGLMQIMGQTAREHGFKGEFLTELCEPSVGLEYGCRKLRACVDAHGTDLSQALLAYNGGSNPKYPGQVIARLMEYSKAPVTA